MAQDSGQGTPCRPELTRVYARLAAAWIVLPSFFLLTGGSLGWWEAWVYSVLVLVPMTVFVPWMARRAPDLFARRFKMKEEEKTQRRLIGVSAPFLVVSFVLPGVDHRFGWSHVPIAVVIAAEVFVACGYLTILRSLLQNRWAGRTVETSPGQVVISSGPYALVRHPMYTGTLALYLATPLALGSWWAFLPAAIILPTLVLRVKNEESVLVRELTGYEDYRQKVRFRLIPYVW